MSESLIQRRTSEKLYSTAEETTEEATIIGTLPRWFEGTYIRVGPGLLDLTHGTEKFSLNHWFDGYSIISKFHVANGKVKFEKKFLQTDAYKCALKVNRPCYTEYASSAHPDPSKGWMSRIYNSIIPEFTDNCNISLFNLGQNIFASGETCFFYDLNISNLNPGQKYDSNKVFGLNVTSPHPLTDRTGTTYNIGSSYAPTLKYCVVKIPPAKGNKDSKQVLRKSQVLCSIPTRWNRNILSYNHSFGLSENFIVFIEQPYVVNRNKILSSVVTKGQCFKDWVEWIPEYKNRFYIIDKITGKLVGGAEFYSEEAFFFLHMINCYEDNGQVVVTLSSYNDPTVLDTQFLSTLREGGTDGDETRAAGHQYIIPINIKDLKNCPEDENLVKIPFSKAIAYRKGSKIILIPEVLTEKGMEFPAINKMYIGRKHRYYYASGLTSLGDYRNAVVKIDIDTKKFLCWRDDNNQLCGEPVFCPSNVDDYDDMESEDSGILICPVTDYRTEASDFIVFIDAKTLKELGRVYFNGGIPLAIHGIFLPSY